MRVLLALLAAGSFATAAEPLVIAKPNAFEALVNPSCSHCVDEARRRKTELKPSDPVLCWTRGYSDGGAIPMRFFLNKYRVISDSYGLFVHDPDAGYSRGFAPSYNFVFHGWRNGVMTMKDKTDGTLYSCLSGVAFDGPRKGHRLKPIPTLVSTWGEVMKRNPHAVAYHMFDKYKPVEADDKPNADSAKTRPDKLSDRIADSEFEFYGGNRNRDREGWRPGFHEPVIAVRVKNETRAAIIPSLLTPGYILLLEMHLGGTDVAVFSSESGRTAGAYLLIARQPRKWKGPHPDKSGVSPPDAGQLLPGEKELPPKKVTLKEVNGIIIDEVTESKWGIDGRAYEGPLKGWTLDPVDDCVVCKYFAYVADYREAFLASGGRQPPVAKPGTDPKKQGADAPRSPDKEKPIAGTAEFLRLLPKPFGVVKAIDPKARTVSLLLDGEKVAKVWSVEPDAEVKVNGFWGRLEQFKPGDRVWVWLKLNRTKNPVSVAMLADDVSTTDLRDRKKDEPSPSITPEQIEAKRKLQQEWLRKQWLADGLPGTLAFLHVFSGEMDVMLDHEAVRWGRSLKAGDKVTLTAEPPIAAVVKAVTPWRERTRLRLVVGELQSSELKPGQRIGVKMAAPPKAVDESVYPPDIGRKRTDAERVEWFLASMYCVCGVGKDTCTGHFYTLGSCNPNGCGAPNSTRDAIRKLIAAGQSDTDIWDQLRKDRGDRMLRPHLRK